MDAPDDQIARFVAMTGCDVDQAAFMLEATGQNFEAALQMFYENHPADAQPIPPRPGARVTVPSAGSAPAAPAAQPAAPAARRRNRSGWLSMPFKIISAGLGVMASVVHLTFSLAGLVGDRVLPAAIMQMARGFVGSLLAAAAEPPDAAAQAHQFAAAFTAKYGNRHPNWTEDSWLNAAVVAHQQYKFLFVYLHSPEHENTGAYVRNVLTSPEVVEYVNEHFVSWGGDVRQPDAFGLSGRLNISTYPAVVLLAFSGTRTKLVAAAQGLVSKQQLLAVLRRVVEEQGMMLTAERLEREEREMSRRLLEEQNAEYEASLAADREREARRQELQRQAEEEERQRALQEAQARAEAEAETQRRLQAAARVALRREQKAASLPPEPAPGSSGIATIRVRLPDGLNKQRRFEPSSTVQVLYDWVDSLEGFDCLNYSLVSAFPKKVFDEDSKSITLDQAGLVPQGALFVQVHDD